MDVWGYPIVDNAQVARLGAKSARRLAAVCPALAMRFER